MLLKKGLRPFYFLRTIFFSKKPSVDLPLHQDFSARFVPWMVGMMLYVSLLFGMISVFLFHAMHRQVHYDTPHLTLELQTREVDREGILNKAIKTLHTLQETERLRVVPSEEIKQAFSEFFDEPFGAGEESAYEPLLIDVWVKGNALSVAQTLAQKIKTKHPDAQILIHQSWTRPIVAWVNWMKWGFMGVSLFLILGIFCVVIFAVRTGVSIHSPILEILDLMGASRHYIVRQFQLQNRQNVYKSLLISLSLLGGSLFCVASFLDQSSSLHLLTDINVLLSYCAVLLVFLFGTICVMWMVTRWVVMGALERAHLC